MSAYDDLPELAEWLAAGNDMPEGKTLAEIKAEIEKTERIRERVYKQLTESDVERGKMIPANFLGALADTAYQALTDWMKKRKIPKTVFDLLECVIFMGRNYSILEAGGNLGEWDYREMMNNIAETVKLIDDFGGSFHGANGSF